MNRFPEAVADIALAHGIPTRDPQAKPTLIDPGSACNLALTDDQQASPGSDLAALPQGLWQWGQVAFDIRGVIQLAGTDLVAQVGFCYPSSVTGIPVDGRASRFHFLHGTSWVEDDGIQIGACRLNYADGQRLELPIVYG